LCIALPSSQTDYFHKRHSVTHHVMEYRTGDAFSSTNEA
jgi:hypothetical protein